MSFSLSNSNATNGSRCPAGVLDKCNVYTKKLAQTKVAQGILKTIKFTKKNTIWLEGRPSIFQYSKNVKNSFFISAWYDFLVPLTKAVSPIKFVKFFKNGKFHIQTDDDWARGPVQKIFDKLWKDPKYNPDAKEIITLKKFNKLKRFRKTKNKLTKAPRQLRIARFIKDIKYWATFMSFYIGMGYGIQTYQGGTVGIDNFSTQTEYALKDNQVQILIDQVPFPHLGIRIGSSVYSFGQTHMTKRKVATYFDNGTYQEMLKDLYPELYNVQNTQKEDGDVFDYSSHQLGKLQSYLAKKTGLDNMPKTLNAINLNLSPEEYINLKNYLESQRAHRYKNLTAVNDCASMIAKALKKNTSFKFNQLIDASPGQIGYALSLMKMAGDDRIGEFYQVSMDSKINHNKLLARNSYIHMMESKLFINFFLFNQTVRSFMEIYYGPEGFVSLDPQIKQLWEVEWKKEFSNYYHKDARINYLYDLGTLVLGKNETINSKDVQKLEKVINDHFEEIYQELKQGELIDLYTQKQNQFKKESLCDEYINLINTLNNTYEVNMNKNCPIL